ncbi:MAG: transcriptional regulator [Candidatus Saccharibacteria bacterium]|nr:transcriptional regulator [Candidatus Saccharibacteria bacterium]
MIEQLFGSKTRVKLLQLFYSHPNRSFYVREITRKIEEQINSVRRELSNLLSVGLIKSSTHNNRLYYEVNQDYEFYEALSQIFGKGVTATKKADQAEPSEVSDIKELGNVSLAFYTGQFTRDNLAGVDLVIVGDVNQTKVEKFVADMEQKEGKEIRFAVMTMDEFQYRQQVNDRFITLAEDAKKQVVIDKENIYTENPDKEPQPAKKEETSKRKPSKKTKSKE